MSNEEEKELRELEKFNEDMAKSLYLIRRFSQAKHHNEAALHLLMVAYNGELFVNNAKKAALTELELGYEKWTEKKEGKK